MKAPLANRIAAHKHTTRLHVLRDRLKRALRDQKNGVPGAEIRVVDPEHPTSPLQSNGAVMLTPIVPSAWPAAAVM